MVFHEKKVGIQLTAVAPSLAEEMSTPRVLKSEGEVENWME
jgi:hypothetical protein